MKFVYVVVIADQALLEAYIDFDRMVGMAHLSDQRLESAGVNVWDVKDVKDEVVGRVIRIPLR